MDANTLELGKLILERHQSAYMVHLEGMPPHVLPSTEATYSFVARVERRWLVGGVQPGGMTQTLAANGRRPEAGRRVAVAYAPPARTAESAALDTTPHEHNTPMAAAGKLPRLGTQETTQPPPPAELIAFNVHPSHTAGQNTPVAQALDHPSEELLYEAFPALARTREAAAANTTHSQHNEKVGNPAAVAPAGTGPVAAVHPSVESPRDAAVALTTSDAKSSPPAPLRMTERQQAAGSAPAHSPQISSGAVSSFPMPPATHDATGATLAHATGSTAIPAGREPQPTAAEREAERREEFASGTLTFQVHAVEGAQTSSALPLVHAARTSELFPATTPAGTPAALPSSLAPGQQTPVARGQAASTGNLAAVQSTETVPAAKTAPHNTTLTLATQSRASSITTSAAPLSEAVPSPTAVGIATPGSPAHDVSVPQARGASLPDAEELAETLIRRLAREMTLEAERRGEMPWDF